MDGWVDGWMDGWVWVSVLLKASFRIFKGGGTGWMGIVSYHTVRYLGLWGSWGVGRVRVCAVLGREGGRLFAGVAFGGTRTSAGAVS